MSDELKGSVPDKPIKGPSYGQFVVVVGRMFGAKTIHGPFDYRTDAEEWAERHARGQWAEVVPLERWR